MMARLSGVISRVTGRGRQRRPSPPTARRARALHFYSLAPRSLYGSICLGTRKRIRGGLLAPRGPRTDNVRISSFINVFTKERQEGLGTTQKLAGQMFRRVSGAPQESHPLSMFQQVQRSKPLAESPGAHRSISSNAGQAQHNNLILYQCFDPGGSRCPRERVLKSHPLSMFSSGARTVSHRGNGITSNLQPSTCNLQPATCNLQLGLSPVAENNLK